MEPWRLGFFFSLPIDLTWESWSKMALRWHQSSELAFPAAVCPGVRPLCRVSGSLVSRKGQGWHLVPVTFPPSERTASLGSGYLSAGATLSARQYPIHPVKSVLGPLTFKGGYRGLGSLSDCPKVIARKWVEPLSKPRFGGGRSLCILW